MVGQQCPGDSDALLAAAATLRKAADMLQAAASTGAKRNNFFEDGDVLSTFVKKEERMDFYVSAGFYLLALQTFILFYCFVWFHFPLWLSHQLRWISDTCEHVTIRLCESPAIVNGVVAMTENITTHPENIEAVSKTAQTVIGSEVFMASMRRIMKHVLLDRDVQRIVGVSISGISKEAMKNTFSWNPNEAEEARRALIDGTDEKFEDDEREDDSQPARGRNPVGIWLRNVLDPQKRREQREIREQEQRERTLRNDSPGVAAQEQHGADARNGAPEGCGGSGGGDFGGAGTGSNGSNAGSRRFDNPGMIPSSKSLDALPDDVGEISPMGADDESDTVAVRHTTPQRRRLMRPQRGDTDSTSKQRSPARKQSPPDSSSSPKDRSISFDSKDEEVSQRSNVSIHTTGSEEKEESTQSPAERWQNGAHAAPPPFAFAAESNEDEEPETD